MFRQFYATTKDRKGHEHNYKLSAGEGVPSGHEITSLSVAGQFKLADILSEEDFETLTQGFRIKGKGLRASAK